METPLSESAKRLVVKTDELYHSPANGVKRKFENGLHALQTQGHVKSRGQLLLRGPLPHDGPHCSSPRGDPEHPWHFSFHRKGKTYRFSLDRHLGKRIESKTEAQAAADDIRSAIRAGTFGA